MNARDMSIVLMLATMPVATPPGVSAATAPGAKPASGTTAPKAAATAPAPSPAAALAGRWRLDIEHSDFGPNVSSKPRERLDVWQREGEAWRVRSNTVRATGDTLKLDWRCREDGVAVTNPLMGIGVQTVGRREGAVLHIVFTASGAFGSILTDERWTVSPDRATLTLERETKGPMGQYRQRYVFRPA